MRFKSPQSNLFQVFAVSGVNTISFGIQASEEAKPGLLGFAVERIDPAKNERYIMPGFKIFRSVIPVPTPEAFVSTWEHPVQSLVWDDFSAEADHEYEYLFHPIKGRSKNLDRSVEPIHIKVHTEPLFSNEAHDIFFNRGVASSQAYQRRFGNSRLEALPPERQAEALHWLTRDLDEAALRFIQSAGQGDTLLGCFYEFRYEPVAREIKAAMDRGVNVRLIIDAKINESTDKKGVFHESFPREDNIKMLNTVEIPHPSANVILRQAKPNSIQHNKFMVLMRGGNQPQEVWTGSTNISLGGFSGQTNVGHWVRDPETARQFAAYWEILSIDPGARDGFTRSQAREANRALQTSIEALHETPTTLEAIPPGITPVFSPRAGKDVLNMYVKLVDSARACSCITLAFGINELFKQQLIDNTFRDEVIFMLLEKRDRPNPRSTKPFVELKFSNNVYQAWGSYIKDPVYQWARETNAQILRLNSHVVYIHSKFLLMDPLGADPIVISGSANFSEASTNDNDENMLIIRGNKRAADIYFTEFNRLFNHYYYRSVLEQLKESGQAIQSDASLFLAEDDKWLEKYNSPRKLRSKRLKLYTDMEGAVTL